jgi:hypothetical protein
MESKSPGRRRERRHSRRPRNGDTRPCAKCGSTSEFSERYRFGGEVVPAWVCENAVCREQIIVRQPGVPIKVGSRKLIHGSKDVRARATRAMMRSRARVERAQKAIDRSTKLQERTKAKPAPHPPAAQPQIPAIVITDAASTIVRVDEQASQLLNVSARRSGLRLLINFFTTGREDLLAAILAVAAGQQPEELRVTLRPRECRPVTVLVRLTAEDGNIRWQLTPAQ